MEFLRAMLHGEGVRRRTGIVDEESTFMPSTNCGLGYIVDFLRPWVFSDLFTLDLWGSQNSVGGVLA